MWVVNPSYHSTSINSKKISHSERLIWHENPKIVELVMIQDMKESKKFWVFVAVTVVF